MTLFDRYTRSPLNWVNPMSLNVPKDIKEGNKDGEPSERPKAEEQEADTKT